MAVFNLLYLLYLVLEDEEHCFRVLVKYGIIDLWRQLQVRCCKILIFCGQNDFL